LLLQSNKIQNNIAHRVTKGLSNKLGTQVSIDNISVDLFSNLVVKGLLIKDFRNDTLIYSGKTSISVNNISLRNKKIELDKINLDNAFLHLYDDSVKNLNLTYFLDHLSDTTTTTKKKWNIKFNSISLSNTRFTYEKQNKSPDTFGVNYSNIRVYNLNSKIKNFYIDSSTVYFKINKLSLNEHSGFNVYQLSSQVAINKHQMHYNDLRLVTQNSNIYAPVLNLDFLKFQTFQMKLV
jgi:hypothetical protein